MKNKRILIGINPHFLDMGVCIYLPDVGKLFKKVTKREKIYSSSGEFTDQIKWINETLKSKKLSFGECVVVIGSLGIDYLEEWKPIKNTIDSFVKFKQQKFSHVSRKTTIADIQTNFIATANFITESAQSIAAANLVSKMLADMGVPIIRIPIDKDYKNQFSDVRSDLNSISIQKAASLVLGKNMDWATSTIEEEKNKWGNRPKSYPTFKNQSQFLIKRS